MMREKLEALAVRFETTRPGLTDKEIAAEIRAILAAAPQGEIPVPDESEWYRWPCDMCGAAMANPSGYIDGKACLLECVCGFEKQISRQAWLNDFRVSLARPAPADGALREVLDKIADIVNRRLAEPGEKDETETLVRIGTVVDAYLSPPSSWPTNEAESEAEANVHSATCPRCFLSFTCTGGCNE